MSDAPRPALITRRSVLSAMCLILIGSAGIQTSSAISAGLFASYGTLGTSAVRMLIAAAVLVIGFRPRLRERSRSEWLGIVIYGTAMAVMNICLYNAIDRLPLGVAVTLDFLGPCAVALVASRRVKEGICALIAVAGVALISLGPSGYFNLAGYLFGLGAAVFFGIYTVFAARVGKASNGLDGLALSVTVAAIITLPFAATTVTTIDGSGWILLAISAVIGVVIPYSVDTIAGRITSARVIGTLFAIDPAMGAIVGYFFLGERLTISAIIGILVVAAAGALIIWFAEARTSPAPKP